MSKTRMNRHKKLVLFQKMVKQANRHYLGKNIPARELVDYMNKIGAMYNELKSNY